MTFLPPYDVDPNPTADTVKEGVLKNDGNISDVYDNLNSLLAMIELIPATGEQILAALLPVDGQGSGLDAEYLGGRIYSEYGLAVHTHGDATPSAPGFMPALDKQKLDGIQNGAEVNVQSNWTETNSSADEYLRNKPKIILTAGGIEDGDTAVFTTPVTLEGRSILEMKSHFGFYQEQDFIDSSTGLSDGGKPVKLNTLGQIDASMIDVSVFHYIGVFTPVAGTEYPDTTGETHGAFWVVQGVDPGGYTFTGGDLLGLTINNGDFMVWGADGWSIMAGEMNPMLYYKLDGTQPLTDPFKAGNNQLKDVADGTAAQDAVTKTQLDKKLNLSGGTVTGSVFFTRPGRPIILTDQLHNYILGYDNQGNDGWFVGRGFQNSNTVALHNYNGAQLALPEGGGATLDGDQLWHEGNFIPATKLDTTGGTLTGDLSIEKNTPTIFLSDSVSEVNYRVRQAADYFQVLADNSDGTGNIGIPILINQTVAGGVVSQLKGDENGWTIASAQIYTDDYHPAVADLLTEINQLKQRITALEEA